MLLMLLHFFSKESTPGERYRCSELRVLCLGYMEPGEPGEPMQEKELLVLFLEKGACFWNRERTKRKGV